MQPVYCQMRFVGRPSAVVCDIRRELCIRCFDLNPEEQMSAPQLAPTGGMLSLVIVYCDPV